ncbi:hypothetical protein GCM10007860_34850 [Chitiniphilus shinanonensis]|uniref:DUF6916 domain-containing protein n=1 Tax=Chitiniphilus shinanonensis TaxID=553088 RepID=A0ABQ6C1D7_9NEIS|nr:hypothetical protein [Chitiniphilus shinanonensis]GLS06307.1 hypothetical protein GCM10007860_34850 [Chitiniphilus shinanonensis]
MLHRIEASHFQPLVGTTCTLALPDGRALAVRVEQVDLKPLSQMPGSRMPFAVALTAPDGTDFVHGPCALDLPALGRLEGMFVSRVPALGRDERAAYFQVVFN